jgi:hypothetical protein
MLQIFYPHTQGDVANQVDKQQHRNHQMTKGMSREKKERREIE